MRIINEHDLDPAIVAAIRKSMSAYSSGGADYSVTTLLNPPRIVHLSRRHWDEIEVDAADLAWAFWGNLGHLALASVGMGKVESRLSINLKGRVISGQTDRYCDRTITDWKFTKVKSIQYQSKIAEWAFQLNSYAMIFEEHGHMVDQCKVHAFLKDWDEYRVTRERGYPPIFIQTIPILLWAPQETLDAMTEKVLRLKAEEDTPDDSLPECTPEEKWQRGRAWAVVKDGKKRAIKGGVFTQEGAARICLKECSFPAHIEERSGSSIRCERYCIVKDFCNVRQKGGV